ncbi:hypothetical protein TNCT_246901 [Trichonephila clavata]|uniref:C2H2-type domain-containing protein n=1 Tax=Trichonephila clavata TaxID=2740835 RepID=A0A8X6K1D5_TRICU|nr:hypothetical protein TNCT_246901 [Trichonephila clavata]
MNITLPTPVDIPICYAALEGSSDQIFDGSGSFSKSKYFSPKMFGCLQCSYTTARMDNLRRHELVHTELESSEKPFMNTFKDIRVTDAKKF